MVDANLLKHLWLQEPGKLRRLPIILLSLGWLLAVIALAGPVWERQTQPVFQAQTARVIVLDLSDSMNAEDIKPSRLMRARFKITDILNQSREGRTALVVFAAEPYLVTPLTDDTATLAAMLPALATDIMPTQGNSGSAALQLAAELLKNAGETHGEVLLITDGVDDQAAMISSVRKLLGQGHRLSILGIGGKQAVTVTDAEQKTQTIPGLNSTVLTDMAKVGGGVYSELTADGGDLERVLLSPSKTQMKVTEDQGSGVERWIERGGWLLPLLLVLAASGFRRGWLGVFLCSVLVVPPPAQAWEWSDLWLNQDQRATRALRKGKTEQAIQQFKNPAWKGVAQRSAGDFASSAKTFEQLDSAMGAYNRGNAQARMEQLDEAAKSYRDALKKDPDYADAKANLDLVEKLIKQKKQEKEKQQEDGEEDQQEKDKESESQQGEKNQEQQSDSSQDDKQQQGDQEQQEQSSGDSKPEKQDSAAEAKKDVENSKQGDKLDKDQKPKEKPGKTDQQVQSGEQGETEAEKPQQANNAEADSEGQKTEEEVALEQWLQQIPDDPGGLLRRKFMLEYINRQKGGGVPR